MYVCVCLAVTEAEVRGAIASGATSREVVTRYCRAGGDCGACHGMIDQMIEEHLEDEQGCPAAADSGERLVATSQLVRAHRAA